MPKLLTVFATAAILIASGGVIWKAGPITNVGSLAPLTKSYTPFEKATYWRPMLWARLLLLWLSLLRLWLLPAI